MNYLQELDDSFKKEKKLKKKNKIQSYFFPSKLNFIELLNYIDKAEKYLYLCVYQITHKTLIQKLIQLANRGIEVAVILNLQSKARQAEQKNRLLKYMLKCTNNTMKICICDETHLMHCKFFIIDDKYVGLGSANWTFQAFERNHENLSIIRSKKVNLNYQKSFDFYWDKFEHVVLRGEELINVSQIDQRRRLLLGQNPDLSFVQIDEDSINVVIIDDSDSDCQIITK